MPASTTDLAARRPSSAVTHGIATPSIATAAGIQSSGYPPGAVISGPQPKMSGPHSGFLRKNSRRLYVSPAALPISPTVVTPARRRSRKLRTMVFMDMASLGLNIPPRAVCVCAFISPGARSLPRASMTSVREELHLLEGDIDFIRSPSMSICVSPDLISRPSKKRSQNTVSLGPIASPL